ncbi:hypothetical protein M409DRAFT_17035 [Zasmidium cellare ATCC 36951]|uniref:Uncharacterized protein n=1 Tax=Zasmidium cellare ATCC 36951 TaxID=1080233 RepID=A0A6A6D0U2_ZASCE|nr:uncharacterized protein M409DRAFT_17035 [Zasmidium cellare ATCC 36951]KAF2173087.1 hypothetical protein M409DRAFT_17035 [Zasmidium cellare ATCC 36951]
MSHRNDHEHDHEPLLAPQRSALVSQNLLRTIARISSLTLETTASPHAHRDNPTALSLLKRAMEVTRPWLEDVRAELEEHGYTPASRDIEAGDEGFRGRLLRELPSLVPVVAGYVMLRRGMRCEGRRVEFLGVLCGVLEGKVGAAEREIERLERLFAREGGRGRRSREGMSERERMAGREREERGWYGEERRRGARDEYYRGDDVGEERSGEDVRGEGLDVGRRRERRRRRRGASRRSSIVKDERSTREERRESRRESRTHRGSRTTASECEDHNRETHDDGEQRRGRPPHGPGFNQMSPEERLRAKERLLAMHLMRKNEDTTKTTTPATTTTPPRATKSVSSGSTESIPRFPPLPIGVHAPRGENANVLEETAR